MFIIILFYFLFFIFFIFLLFIVLCVRSDDDDNNNISTDLTTRNHQSAAVSAELRTATGLWIELETRVPSPRPSIRSVVSAGQIRD